ncbi:hypothetical protein ACEWY4_020326 [Coilia grayii]|uniref:C1q domain-containing protein n=1 Tax=Coilia grayii TaxID=363190 RepID=A0ABD1JCC1_9TELE
MLLSVLLLHVTALLLANGLPAERGDSGLAEELQALKDRLTIAEKEVKELKDVPRVAFSASLGGNGLVSTKYGQNLIYKDVITNIGDAYNLQTGVFTAPVKGLYYVRFTANAPTSRTMSAVLYKGNSVLLIAHEQPSGEGSDTASNGGAVLLEKGDELHMNLWPNTQIWDNSNRHSTFTVFLLYPVKGEEEGKGEERPKEEPKPEELQALKDRLAIVEKELKELKDVPRVAFSASLGGNGLVSTTFGQNLIYKDVITNIGDAYNLQTGVFTAPVKGVYYVRFTANAPTSGTMSAVLYKGKKVLLIVHEQPSGEGSDTASNGGAVLLEKGDELHMNLWPDTQIWDNSNRHSTFTIFLLYPV